MGGGGNVLVLPANALQANDEKRRASKPNPILVRSPIPFLISPMIPLKIDKYRLFFLAAH